MVGAGPGGLTAATALAQDGHEVTVLERHPALQQPGSGLMLQPAASKCLFDLGGKELFEKHNIPPLNMVWWSYKHDEPMAVTPFESGGHSATPVHRSTVGAETHLPDGGGRGG